MVELKRDIYSKLVQWKNNDSGKVLVLSAPVSGKDVYPK